MSLGGPVLEMDSAKMTQTLKCGCCALPEKAPWDAHHTFEVTVNENATVSIQCWRCGAELRVFVGGSDD